MKNTLIVSAAVCAFALNVSAKTYTYSGWNTGDAELTKALIAELEGTGWKFNDTIVSTTGSDNKAPGISKNSAYIQTPEFENAITNILWNGRATGTGSIIFSPVKGSAENVETGKGIKNYTLTYDPGDAVTQVKMYRDAGQVYFYSVTINTLDPPYPTPVPSVEETRFPEYSVSWPSVNASDYALVVSNATDEVLSVSGGAAVFEENSGVYSYSFSVPKAGVEYSVGVKALPGIFEDVSYDASPWGVYRLSVPAAPALSKPGVSAEEITKSSVTVSWPGVENASGYAVSASFNGVEISGENLSAGSTSWTVSDLMYNTKYQFSVTALGDGLYYSDSPAFVEEFTTAADSSAPEWTINPVSPEFAAGSAGSFTVSAVRGDDNLTSSITLSVSPSPVSAPVLSDGSVFWTPAWEDAGKTFTFTFSVSAGGNDYEYLVLIPLEALPTLSLSVDPVSAAINLGETAETLLSAEASDDRDPLALTAVVCGSDDLAAHLDAETGAFSWTPSAAGEYTVVFDASADAAYPLSMPAEFRVAVTNAEPALSVVSTNGVKVSSPVETLLAPAGKETKIIVEASDVFAAPQLTVSPEFADGFTVATDGVKATGTLVWTFENVGDAFEVTFTATDSLDSSLFEERTISVTVVDPPLEPVWPSVSDNETTANSFTLEWDGENQPRLDHYEMRVWYGSCDMGSETTDKETFFEWFDNYQKKDSKYFPQGWTVDNGVGRYSKENAPLQLNSDGQKIITKKYPRPLTGFSFHINNNKARSVSTNAFEVYASKGGVDDGDWTLIPNDQCGEAGTKTFVFDAADGYRRIKVAAKFPSCNIGIGSFSATYAGAGTHFVVGSLEEAETLGKEQAERIVSGLGSSREYFVQFVTCGTSGEKKRLYAGSGTREFYTRVMTLEPEPVTVMLFK